MTTDDHNPTNGYGEAGASEPVGDDDAVAPAVEQPAVEEPELPWEPEDAAALEPAVAWEPGEGDAWQSDSDESWDVDDELAPEDELPPEREWEPALDEAALLTAAEVTTESETPLSPYQGEGVELAPEPEEADEADEADASQTPVGEGRGLVGALALLVVALLLLTGWLSYTVADARGAAPIEKTRSSALAAGRDAARLVFSYDYRHLDKDFAAAAAVTTGTFKTDYANTTKKLVGDVAPRYKAVLLAEVSEAAVVTASDKQVLLLVFLDVQSTSTLASTPKITPRRLKMTMLRVGDRWLVSNVDAF